MKGKLKKFRPRFFSYKSKFVGKRNSFFIKKRKKKLWKIIKKLKKRSIRNWIKFRIFWEKYKFVERQFFFSEKIKFLNSCNEIKSFRRCSVLSIVKYLISKLNFFFNISSCCYNLHYLENYLIVTLELHKFLNSGNAFPLTLKLYNVKLLEDIEFLNLKEAAAVTNLFKKGDKDKDEHEEHQVYWEEQSYELVFDYSFFLKPKKFSPIKKKIFFKNANLNKSKLSLAANYIALETKYEKYLPTWLKMKMLFPGYDKCRYFLKLRFYCTKCLLNLHKNFYENHFWADLKRWLLVKRINKSLKIFRELICSIISSKRYTFNLKPYRKKIGFFKKKFLQVKYKSPVDYLVVNCAKWGESLAIMKFRGELRKKYFCGIKFFNEKNRLKKLLKTLLNF